MTHDLVRTQGVFVWLRKYFRRMPETQYRPTDTEAESQIASFRAFFSEHPDAWAKIISDESFVRAMYHASGVKVDVQVQQIHAPANSARKLTGHGRTLCNNKGVRGPNVTCKHCLRKLGGTR